MEGNNTAPRQAVRVWGFIVKYNLSLAEKKDVPQFRHGCHSTHPNFRLLLNEFPRPHGLEASKLKWRVKCHNIDPSETAEQALS
jgi:hypothetical protein